MQIKLFNIEIFNFITDNVNVRNEIKFSKSDFTEISRERNYLICHYWNFIMNL